MRNTRLPGFILVLAFLIPSSAIAAPITVSGSTWSLVAPAGGQDGAFTATPFWGGLSWDCAECGIGYLLDAIIGNPGNAQLEYLNDGGGGYTPFCFDDTIEPTYVTGMTAWTNGVFGQNATGAFTYDSGTGRTSNSWDSPGQYALFRLVGPETTTYFVGVEDILLSETFNDHDYNDYIVTFTTPTSVPEPSTLLLLGSSMAALSMRRRISSWKTSRRTKSTH
jgi:hypothetical protein